MTVAFSLHGHQVVFELPDTTDPIQNRISEARMFFDLDLLEDMRARVRSGGLCVDVGANVGNHTVFLAKICGMRVMAFESDPHRYRLLVRQVALNGLEELVRTFDVAPGDGSGDVATLDQHIGADTVALMRVSAASEHRGVLDGAAATIARDAPIIYAETIESAQTALANDQRRQMLQDTRDVRERIISLGSTSHGLKRRLADIEADLRTLKHRDLARRSDALEGDGSAASDHAALLYELWNLGVQTYDQITGARADTGRVAKPYHPLNRVAADLASWVPRRKRWTIPNGTDAGSFLQGYTAEVSAHPGDYVNFHLSTSLAPMFVKIRVFGFGDRGQIGPSELEVSPALAVPKTGVWESGRSARQVDERQWHQVYKLRLGKNWRPGCYIARFETIDGNACLHPFWVTSSDPESRTLRISATLTHFVRNKWQATSSSTFGALFRAPARTSRFPRPFGGSRGGEALRHELPLFRWASANAVALDCRTDMDIHRDPALLDSYDHLVIAGDCRYLTRELLDALAAFKARGGSISVFGAAPGEHEVTLDLDAGTITRVSQTASERARWRSAGAKLWHTSKHWIHKGAPLDLCFTPQAGTTVLADSEFAAPVSTEKLCDGRISGTDLEDSDPMLLARARAGHERCDTTLEMTREGGRVFVAGTDRWPMAIGDLFNPKGVRGELDFITARLLGASTDRATRQPLVSVIMTAYDSADFVARAIDSILAQSYAHFELIIVDDNSSDATFDVLIEYAAKDRRVRPFKSFRNNGTYWSKNFGITRARGELITFQDSDDTSTPDRLLQQVQALRWNPAAVASMVDYERRDEAGVLLLNRGVTQRRCFPSLMIRASEVIGRLGFFDSVRTSADQEHLHRLRLVFGADRVVEIGRPLYQALVRQGSLTMSGGSEVALEDNGRSHLSESRRDYVERFKRWHERIELDGVSPRIDFPLLERPFEAPDAIGIETGRTQAATAQADGELAIESYRERTVRDAEGSELGFTIEPLPGDEGTWHRIVGIARPDGLAAPRSATDFDVVMMSDFRFPGGTSQSNAAEIIVQARQGLVTGLAHVPSPVLKRNHPINPVIQRLVDQGSARFVPADQPVTCKLLVIRHPSVLEQPIDVLPRIRADEVAVIVNQAPSDDNTGRVFYDMAGCQAKARQRFGSEGTWFPIGPLVRKTVADLPGSERLSPNDWENIIDLDDWAGARTGFVGDVPVIGRHSRDTPDKWPPDRETILAAYPATDLEVRVLGGAAPVKDVLGSFPTNWEVLEFGAEKPQDFLRTIDFLVYFHHPSLVEAFGRTILEAMAAGVPAIIPQHFAELFEDRAVYAEPHEVLGIVKELYGDRARYEQLSRGGIELARRRFSYAAHVGRLTRLIPELGTASAPTTPSEGAGAVVGSAVDTAYLEPDAIYKFGFELSGVSPTTRGRLRCVSRTTSRDVLVIEIDGTKSAVSEFVVNAEGRTRVDVFIELDAGAPFAVDKMRVRRRADRPRQPALDLTDNSVTAAFATYPGRREVVPAVIESLAPQVDKLFVYLNNYDDVPGFVRETPYRDRIVFILDPASQLRAAAKFHWLEKIRGYHLVCDDDIIYPPDYARRMVAAIERRHREAIVGVHGVVFERELVDARSSRRSVFKFPDELLEDTPVHFLGTGTVALHSSVLERMNLSELDRYPIANDEILAVIAKDAGVPMVCVNRATQWLVPHPHVEFGIFEERQIDGGEHDKATELLASANPWPELGALE